MTGEREMVCCKMYSITDERNWKMLGLGSLWNRVGVGVESCTTVFLAGHILYSFVHTCTFAVGCIV